MSQFSKYLEIVKEERNYNYDHLEIYDESIKDAWNKIKEMFTKSKVIIIASLLSLILTSQIQKYPNGLLSSAKEVLNKKVEDTNYKFNNKDKEIISNAIKYIDEKTGKRTIIEGDVETIINVLQTTSYNKKQVEEFIKGLGLEKREVYQLTNDALNLGM
jgi:wyosine [tRNA(Phe)-imidazoG37] synthetase (radical SAM superfamily)